MASPRKLSHYPSEFPDIFKRALRLYNYGILLPFPSRDAAKRFRQRLYAYRAALLADPSFDPYLALLAPTARLTIVGPDLRVTYPQRELSRIREALEKSK